jgi:glycosyltransferase involved in cell wall biosynthesis
MGVVMTTPAHIMMTADAVGGVWVYALALARRLAEAGCRVTIVTLGPPPTGPRCQEAHALPASAELIVTDLDLEWRDPEGRDTARAQSELLGLADRLGPDLVHINGYREAAIPWQCPSVVVAHSCVMSWWEAVRREPPGEPCWLVYAEAVRAGLNRASTWAAPTQAFRHCIEKIYRPKTPGVVIPNGIDFPAQPAIAKEPFILASGRIWDSGKNLAALTKIASRLPWPVCIAGAGMPDDAATSPNVRWLGEIDHAELQDWMLRAAIYAAPACYEPFGLGILEAARAGCALALSDIKTLRELWDGAALHIPAGEPELLRKALADLCADDRARRDLQRAAVNRASTYSLDRMLHAYTKLYRRVLAHAAEGGKPFGGGSELVA